MDKQALLNKIESQTGQDFSRNRGIRSYLSMINRPKLKPWYGESVEALYKTFMQHTDLLTAMAAAIICANKYLNGGQLPGFYGQYMKPEDEMSSVYCNPEQARKTLKAIKPETIAKYQQAIVIINRERSNHQ